MLATLLLLLAADPLTATLKRPADTVTITPAKEGAVLAITSKSGIGAVTLHRPAKGWPKPITVAINLKSLEGLSLKQEDRLLRTSLGSDTHEGLRRAGERWVEAKLDAALAPKIAKTPAGITIEIPAGWLDAEHDALTIEWIDFYR